MDKDKLEKDLTQILDTTERNISVENLPMTIGELITSYQEKTLIIRPEYQRLLKWDTTQKTQLIESLLIGLPIPNIFVARDEKGRWEIVDGLQRISTIIDFIIGLDIEDTNKRDKLYERFDKLSSDGLEYLHKKNPLLKGKGIEYDFVGKTFNDFPEAMKLDFRRTRINTVVLKKNTSEDVKYALFQRLNGNSSPILPQELRNAILQYKCPEYGKMLENLAKHKFFTETFYFRSKNAKNNEYADEHLILLTFALFHTVNKNQSLNIQNIENFMTDFINHQLIDNRQSYSVKDDENMLQEMFDYFCSLNEKNDNALNTLFKIGDKFSQSKYLVLIFGYLLNGKQSIPQEKFLNKIQIIEKELDSFKTAHDDIDLQENIPLKITDFIKRGVSAASRIPKIIEYAHQHFA